MANIRRRFPATARARPGARAPAAVPRDAPRVGLAALRAAPPAPPPPAGRHEISGPRRPQPGSQLGTPCCWLIEAGGGEPPSRVRRKRPRSPGAASSSAPQQSHCPFNGESLVGGRAPCPCRSPVPGLGRRDRLRGTPRSASCLSSLLLVSSVPQGWRPERQVA